MEMVFIFYDNGNATINDIKLIPRDGLEFGN